MLSVIVYGRNDNYGYNLHKRVALSINCMAEMLDAVDDEILFVDYNTPDDHPTCPEAIRDTLTARALRLLRIFRVRPAQHQRFRNRTHLMALEPIARNVALRRSNPDNRWILSTNTDMIFVPRDDRALGDSVSDLAPALYHLPRFEVPETLWEGLDRMDPCGSIAEIGRWGSDLHLNEIVLGSSTVLYDGPGDFQLAPRSDLFGIDGFDERMLLGWHVDSNLARRLGFLHGPPRSVVDRLFGYHCDHTRQVTPAHRHDRVQNDWVRFVDGLTEPTIPEQTSSWGLGSEPIEEIRLADDRGHYVGALRSAIGEAMQAPTEIAYNTASYDKVGYDSRHVVPFLVDALSCYERSTVVGWIGVEPALLDRFALAWRELGFTGDLLLPDEASWLPAEAASGCRRTPMTEIARAAGVLVIDFGPRPVGAAAPAPEPVQDRVVAWFEHLVAAERERLSGVGSLPRRFVVVNAVHGRFESIVQESIGAAAAPIATRMRQGFVLPKPSIVRDILQAPSEHARPEVLVLRLRRRAGRIVRRHAVLSPIDRWWRRWRDRKLQEVK